ncbi:MAG: hypothetical protein GEU73_17490 [Chloroflexi bacterium]|nr:hypothetical protein [Chloroflexota bacterium]
MAEPSQSPLPDRIQRELDEALRQGGADKLPARPRRKRRPFRLRFPDPRPRNPGQLVLYGIVLFGAGYLLAVPFRSYLIAVGILCVIVAVLTYFIQPHGHVRKYWRGRYVDVPTGSWQEHFYRLIYRRP